MRIVIEPGELERDGVAGGIGGPEKGFLVVGARRNASPSREAVLEARARAHGGSRPDDAAAEDGPGTERVSGGEDEVRGVEAAGTAENAPTGVEGTRSGGEGSSARERFERRAQEIARAAEVGEGSVVEDEADLLPTLVEERLPEVPHESGLARRDPAEQSRGEDADARVEQGPIPGAPESRDAVPFGLKRRVPIGMAVFGHEERRRAARFAVPGRETREVRRDRGVGVHDEKVAAGEARRRVAQGARGAQDLGLEEKRELWRARRLLAQHALDLLGQVMEIYRHLCDAGLLKAPQVLHRHRDVQER